MLPFLRLGSRTCNLEVREKFKTAVLEDGGKRKGSFHGGLGDLMGDLENHGGQVDLMGDWGFESGGPKSKPVSVDWSENCFSWWTNQNGREVTGCNLEVSQSKMKLERGRKWQISTNGSRKHGSHGVCGFSFEI